MRFQNYKICLEKHNICNITRTLSNLYIQYYNLYFNYIKLLKITTMTYGNGNVEVESN